MMTFDTPATPSTKLAHFPLPFFGAVMGFSGLTLAWFQAHALFASPLLVGQILAVFTLMLLACFVVLYGLKTLRHFPQVKAELQHPVRANFVAGISISFMLAGAIAQHLHLIDLGYALWLVGAVGQLVATLFSLNRWMHHEPMQIVHSNPAWFIPVVGNLIVPMTGISILSDPEPLWFYFSIGIFFWLVLQVILMYRLFFHGALPEKLLPTLFIFIAPPAVGFISYIALQEQHASLDPFAKMLYYTALLMVLLLLSDIRRYTNIAFSLSWWAYSFPVAAFTVASMHMFELSQRMHFKIIAILALALLSVLMVHLTIKTLKAAKAGRICVPE